MSMSLKCVPASEPLHSSRSGPQTFLFFFIFIVSHGIIKVKGLQFPGTNFMDKTLKPPESTYKTTFLVLSRMWYKFVPGLGALSP